MRGKAFGKICNNLFNRITPAYAGKRYAAWDGIFDTEDHPRLCGEKLSQGLLAVLSLGSPPPMRGKDTHFRGFLAYIGITPAYAGKSIF